MSARNVGASGAGAAGVAGVGVGPSESVRRVAAAMAAGAVAGHGPTEYELRVNGRAVARFPSATAAALASFEADNGAYGKGPCVIEVVPVHAAVAPEALADVLEAADERICAEPLVGSYVECPGCTLVVFREDRTEHAGRCVALKALVAWEIGRADLTAAVAGSAAVANVPAMRPDGSPAQEVSR